MAALGHHMNLAAGSLAHAQELAAEEGCILGAAQVNIYGAPYQVSKRLAGDAGRALVAPFAAAGVRLVAHNSHGSVPWGASAPGKQAASVAHIRAQVEECGRLGLEGLVVHIPTCDHAADAVVARARELVPECGTATPRVFLENPHLAARHPGHRHHFSPAHFADLVRRIRENADPPLARYGVCIDTAHLWASGVDLTTAAQADAWLAEFDEAMEAQCGRLPPGTFMLHLNDSGRIRGRGADNHSALGAGNMWRDVEPGASGAAPFLRYAERERAMVIFERNEKTPELRQKMRAQDYRWAHAVLG